MFDAIIIGSGFGGAVTACRLAERGARVLVLERGRRWDPRDYPREPGDAWVWDQEHPERRNGWLDFRVMDDMCVAQGAGVGGGSLIYANVVVEAKPEAFATGWPPQIRYDALRPYYDKVGEMLSVQTIPEAQATARYKLVKEAAEKSGFIDRFRPVPLAVRFDPQWSYSLNDPFSEAHSKEWTNDQGQKQGTCIHCGNCDIGCRVRAKNTLDLNYIAKAEASKAEVRPLHVVTRIVPERNGYRVYFDRLVNCGRVPGSEWANRVIVAAGSLGSTELLFRCRDQYKTLPHISRFLGRNWSSNGDFLTPAIYENRRVSPTQGPTITCAIDFLDGSQGAKFFVEDGGFPDVFGNYLEEWLRRPVGNRRIRRLLRDLAKKVRKRDPLSNVMPWFGQGIDGGDGHLYLGRPWWMPWRRRLKLDWDVTNSKAMINNLIAMHERLSEATDSSDLFEPPTWSIWKNLVTPHPLGGCNMGTNPENGVVNHGGEVFGYPRLYVADGAIIPRPIGLNPSRTIAALAERISDLMMTT